MTFKVFSVQELFFKWNIGLPRQKQFARSMSTFKNKCFRKNIRLRELFYGFNTFGTQWLIYSSLKIEDAAILVQTSDNLIYLGLQLDPNTHSERPYIFQQECLPISYHDTIFWRIETSINRKLGHLIKQIRSQMFKVRPVYSFLMIFAVFMQIKYSLCEVPNTQKSQWNLQINHNQQPRIGLLIFQRKSKQIINAINHIRKYQSLITNEFIQNKMLNAAFKALIYSQATFELTGVDLQQAQSSIINAASISNLLLLIELQLFAQAYHYNQILKSKYHLKFVASPQSFIPSSNL